MLLLGGAVRVGDLDGLLELAERRFGAATVVHRPAEVVVQRHAPAQHPRVAHAGEHVEALCGPLLLVPGVVQGEHVQRVEHEERRARERRLAHAAGELGHGLGGASGGCLEPPPLDGHPRPELGGLRRGRTGLGDRFGLGGDGVEHRRRLFAPALDAERAGELGRHHGAHMGGVLIVVDGLPEPFLAAGGIAEIPQPVDHLLFAAPMVGRFGKYLVGRVIHRSIMAAPGGRRYAAGSMTRIIAGFAGSLTIQVPRSGTRPTSDRVREAIFSALDARDAIRHASVVDLYAGSGALGLEAASRGAAEVVLVERAKPAADVCRRNADAVQRAARGHVPVRIRVVMRTVAAYLEGAAGGIDLAFIDPPYELGEEALARDLELLAPLLAADAIVVVERSSRSPEPVWPAGIELDRRRDYGETTLWWSGATADQPVRPSQPE